MSVLHTMRVSERSRPRHAVVIGASLAGLMAARVLARNALVQRRALEVVDFPAPPAV